MTIGTPRAIQAKNEIRTPAIRCSIPIPIRFGGVPTGVPMPPIDAPNDVINIMASANARRLAAEEGSFDVARLRCASIDSPIGNIIAVVAVLLIHIERTVATPPYAVRMRAALVPTRRDDSAV